MRLSITGQRRHVRRAGFLRGGHSGPARLQLYLTQATTSNLISARIHVAIRATDCNRLRPHGENRSKGDFSIWRYNRDFSEPCTPRTDRGGLGRRLSDARHRRRESSGHAKLGGMSDWKFFLDNDDLLKRWAHRYGGSGVRALAEELRRLPWRTGATNPTTNELRSGV